jgi:hypothetical protein
LLNGTQGAEVIRAATTRVEAIEVITEVEAIAVTTEEEAIAVTTTGAE